jgi:hypothetical protein
MEIANVADLVNLGELSKPLTKLVEVVARGIGNAYEPIGTVRQAKAEAKAQLIRAGANIAERELLERAAARLGHVEVMRQENIESVVKIAEKQLPAEVDNKSVSQDWINHFFSGVQDVSDSDLQHIWGKILAGEVATPGSYSRRLIEFMKTMDSSEAAMLSAVMSVSFQHENGWYFYFSTSRATFETVFEKLGSKIDWQGHLTDIGILSSEEQMPRASSLSGKKLSFGGAALVMDGPPPPPPKVAGQLQMIELWADMRNFTSLGQQLASVATVQVDPSIVGKINTELADLKVSMRSRTNEESK